MADASGAIRDAAQGYAAALAEAPFDEALATRAYRRAIAAGDRALAREAAVALQAAGALPPDGEFLFLVDAIEARDWAAARSAVDRIEEDGLFESIVPLLRAWIAFGAGDADPLAIIDAAPANLNSTAYANENRALLMLAMGRYEEGAEAFRNLAGLGTARMLRLQVAAAARLAEGRRWDEAMAVLEGDSRTLRKARERIERHRRLPGAVDSAATGIGELFVRLGADVNQRNVSLLALTLSRFAGFLAPENSIAWLISAVTLAADGQFDAALAALDHIPEDDPFFADAQDTRVRLLVEMDEVETALAVALAQTEERDVSASDWSRVGELYSQLDRSEDAVEAYGRALSLAGGEDAPWSAWLLYGGALLDAGRWEDAHPMLDRAVELAPDQPLVLNYLGYALLERRENLERAEELIRRASELSPDNASITDSLGWVHYVQGDVAEAIPILEQASRGDPDEPTINEHLGDAYWTAGRRRDARFAWRAALVTAEDDAAQRIRTKLEEGLTPATASP